jgi:hypothetical protein
LGQDTTAENRTSLVPTVAQAAPERRKRRKSVFKGSDSEEPHGIEGATEADEPLPKHTISLSSMPRRSSSYPANVPKE